MNQLELITTVLRIVSDEFDIEYEDMYRYIKLRMRLNDKPKIPETTTTANKGKKQCLAYVKNATGISQCDRGATCENFCKTHFKQHNEGKLKHGHLQEVIGNGLAKTIRKVNKIQLLPDHHLYQDPRTGQIYISDGHKSIEVSVHS